MICSSSEKFYLSFRCLQRIGAGPTEKCGMCFVQTKKSRRNFSDFKFDRVCSLLNNILDFD